LARSVTEELSDGHHYLKPERAIEGELGQQKETFWSHNSANQEHFKD